MPAYKPLVLVSGQPQQLQAGDTLDATTTEVEVISCTAGAGDIVIGNPVYISADSTIIKAKADAVGTTGVIGFAKESKTAGAATIVQTAGVVTLTTGQWDTIAGTTGGLIFNTVYYLSGATAGLITATAPTSGYVLELGRAVSTTSLKINIHQAIKL
jgi:hypothetical protein